MKKQYTLEELKQSPYTIMDWIIKKGNATLDDAEEVKSFYKENAKGKYKRLNSKDKRFMKMYRKQLEVYNNRKY